MKGKRFGDSSTLFGGALWLADWRDMTAHPRPSDDSAPDASLDDIRRRVLSGTLSVLAVGVPAVSVLMLVQAFRHGELGIVMIVLTAYTLVFPLARWLSPRIGFRASALTLLGLLVLTTFLIASRGGVAVGNVVMGVLVLLLGALFFGRRGAALGLLAVVVVFATAGFMVVSGLGPPLSLGMWDPNQTRFWLRETIVFGLCGLAVVVAQTYIVERLSSETQALRRLAARESAQRLELERAEREREHEREQRKLAQQALEESRRIEALARLSGGIAHDFNNNLTVIMGSAEMLKWQASTLVDARQCADDIIRAARGAAELTRQLLTLGRRHVSKPVPVNMPRALSQLQTTARRVVARDISIEVDALESGITAYVDPVELERALFNLVLNASDAMPTGGKLHITCHREVRSAPSERLPEGRYVVLSFADDGQGMDAATLERIFEPFFTTKGPGSGTGLGLATVHAFAKAAGGDIGVTSEKGRGTTFTLFLPEHTDAGAEHEAPLPTPAVRASQRRSRRVLVVEDQAEVRASIVRILTGHGFDTFDVSDGDQAIAAVEQKRDFAVMCIDGVMPGTGTAAVLARVAELSPATRVLVCSGYVKEDLVRRGIAMGKYAFLAKPFSSRQLIDSIQGLLSSSAPGQTPDGAATSGGLATQP